MVGDLEQCVQRELNYAIVDEVDSILIDEARTPLIISGPTEDSTDLYYRIDRIIPALKRDVDYTIEEKTKTAALTEEGNEKVERALGVENLYDAANMTLVHHVVQGLRAHVLYNRDVDYVVKDGEVLIVDEFTGRLMPGRRWSDGLHQAVEAKEGVKIERENQTLATITIQNYFRMYAKLAGMTGTADTEAVEFKKIYKLDVVVMPPNKPMHRVDHPDVVYKSEREKFDAVVEEIKKELAALEERRGDALRRLTDAHRKILDFSPYRAIRARYEEVSSVELIPAVRDRDPIPERYRRVKEELETTLLGADAGGAVATERSALEDLRARYEAALAAWGEGGCRTDEAGRELDERRSEYERGLP